MTLDLTAMRRLLRKGLGGLDAVDLPDVEADELLNMSFWEIEDKFDFTEKDCEVPGTLIPGIRVFQLPNALDAILSVAVQDLSSLTWKKLGRMSQHLLDEISNETASVQGKPRLYRRRADTIVLEPIPDDAYPIRINLLRTIESLLEGSFETTQLPRNWDEMVVEGAIARGHFYNQDYSQSRQASDDQLSKIRGAVLARGKEEKLDSRYARLQVLWDDPTLE